MIGLNAELFDSVKRNVLCRRRHETVVVLASIEQVVATLRASAIYREAHSYRVVRRDGAGDESHEVVRAAGQRRQRRHLVRTDCPPEICGFRLHSNAALTHYVDGLR